MNWPAFVAGVLLTSVAGWQIHDWRVDSLKAAWATERDAAVATAKAETQEVCDKNNQITKETAHELQGKLDATAARYYKLLRHNPARAGEPAAAGAARRGDEAAGAAVPVVQVPVVDGLDAGRLNDEQAAALTTLQDVVAEIYKANGQAELLPAEYRDAK